MTFPPGLRSALLASLLLPCGSVWAAPQTAKPNGEGKAQGKDPKDAPRIKPLPIPKQRKERRAQSIMKPTVG